MVALQLFQPSPPPEAAAEAVRYRLLQPKLVVLEAVVVRLVPVLVRLAHPIRGMLVRQAPQCLHTTAAAEVVLER
jgi:hypothetical protein